MVRSILAGLAAMALAAAAGAAVPQAKPGKPASFGQKGGVASRSTDEKWRIFSKAPEKPGASWNDSRSMASLWLQGVGVPEKRLTTYRRGGTLFWLGGGRHAVFVHKDAHLQDARLFTLYGAESPQRQIQLAIEKSMAATPPPLASVENRLISVKLAAPGGLCLTVEESGLPPGKSEGSFLTKTGVFRVASNGSTMRVKTCPASGGTTKID